MSALLEVRALRASYGAGEVLSDINLELGAGEFATLLGRNGMGKTTTVRAILGLTRPLGGEIRFGGERIDGWKPDRIARAGIGLVPEGRQIFPNLTVRENLTAFAAARAGAARTWTLERVLELFPQIARRLRHYGSELSGGEQQMLAIGRALMTRPRLLILDEATEGLAPLVRAEIWRCLAALKGEGQTLLVIDKYVRKLVALADHHTIVERGRTAWRGSSRALNADPGLWHRYLGV
ncbi:MAG TPA: ABC transporter ATP-binding protein [Burkholderiales bacterium]|nr:ABC transporter ATP-binding protein [Burkholderiales bacterium]